MRLRLVPLVAIAVSLSAGSTPAVGSCIAELNFQGHIYGPTSTNRGYSVGPQIGSGSIPQDCPESGVSTDAPPPLTVAVRAVRGIHSADAVLLSFAQGFVIYARAGYVLPATTRAVINDAWGQRLKGSRSVAVGLTLARGAVVTLSLTRGSLTVGSGRLTKSGALRIRADHPIGRGAYVLAGAVAFRGVRIPLRFPFVIR